MSNGRFGILAAAKKACLFVTAQREYLLRIGFLPLCLQVGTALLMQFFDPKATVLETYVWAFPSNLVFAWFMFAEARLLLLGERLDRLPKDEGYLAARRHAMNLAVVILLLFDTSVAGAGAWVEWATRPGNVGVNVFASFSVVFLIGAMMWGLRFSVVHILAAVGYPIRAYLLRARGLEFSLRLIAMSLLLGLPVYFVLEVILEAAFGTGELPPGQAAVVICLTAPVAMTVSVVLNAAAAFALKDMLGKDDMRKDSGP